MTYAINYEKNIAAPHTMQPDTAKASGAKNTTARVGNVTGDNRNNAIKKSTRNSGNSHSKVVTGRTIEALLKGIAAFRERNDRWEFRAT